jgi:hypothetical protein
MPGHLDHPISRRHNWGCAEVWPDNLDSKRAKRGGHGYPPSRNSGLMRGDLPPAAEAQTTRFGDIQNEDSKTAGVPKSAFTRKTRALRRVLTEARRRRE